MTGDLGLDKLALDDTRQLVEHYELGKVLGEGAYGKVRAAHLKADPSQQVAIKILKRPPTDQLEKLVQEVEIMRRLQHPNVVKVIDLFLTSTKVYIVMEHVAGGELFDAIVKQGQYTEMDARRIARTLCETIAYFHEKGVAHRDLKPDNVLLSDNSPGADVATGIKIADFGLSKAACEGEELAMRTACGTPGYVAPEVITRQPYSTQVDMWSLGVIVYVLLSGRLPFDGANDTEVCHNTVHGSVKFFSPYWDSISNEAKSFVSALLQRRPEKRLTAVQALKHPWFSDLQSRDSVDLFRAKTTRALPTLAGLGGNDEANTTMRQVFMEYNLDRRAMKHMLIRSMFELDESEQIIDKFKCYDGSGYKPSRLYITTSHVCLLAQSGDKVAIPMSELHEVIKAKRFFFTPGDGHSIYFTTKTGQQ
eukprot:CAMPEP_0119413524 /NCGR_PEP_ID=MMETSP1335-20130426/5582_1 /TAXON_ID=259385 /ORGANISM="Chrysoculter rhomboideus, Strain RCC1486" /LENGTH=420 /DNA_ID=CAMNT_0007438323 /DNA_START=83 /DNA_END=1342 /DNA_ORIENTATION=+